MAQIEGAGVALSYQEAGEGRPVLIIHGLASSAADVWPVAEAVAGMGARAIAYDRRGYGDSGAPQPYTATTVQEQAQDALALMSGLSATPALLAGDGFGALVVLDLLVRHPALVAGAVLVDAPLFAFVPEATEMLAAERAMLEDALRDGGPARAVQAWLGPDVPSDRVVRAQAAQRGFFADYGGLASWSVTRRELREITAPVVVLTRPDAPPHVTSAADSLARHLPQARRRDGADLVGAIAELLR